jgi:hypothetical protein
MPSVILLWNVFGPSGSHRQRLERGQPDSISSICFEGSLANSMPSASPTCLHRWATSKLLAVPLQSSCGPSASHRHHQVMGQYHAIGHTALECVWAIRKPSAASGERPTRFYRQHPIRTELGQFHAIGIDPSERGLANSKRSLALLRSNYWLSASHRQILVVGQLLNSVRVDLIGPCGLSRVHRQSGAWGFTSTSDVCC